MDENYSESHIRKRAYRHHAQKGEPVIDKNEKEGVCGSDDSGDMDTAITKKKKGLIVVGCGRRGSGGGGGGGGGGDGVAPPSCQVEKCGVDLTNAKRYHRRHKVCEVHAKAPGVVVAGVRQRFCQQCSRFHEVSEFDEAKRSCRRRLAGHNERRRKNSSEFQGEGSSQRGKSHQLRENQCRPADERVQITLPGNSTCEHFHIR